jgi:hypothetical protein
MVLLSNTRKEGRGTKNWESRITKTLVRSCRIMARSRVGIHDLILVNRRRGGIQGKISSLSLIQMKWQLLNTLM